jgi:hypothetical protein
MSEHRSQQNMQPALGSHVDGVVAEAEADAKDANGMTALLRGNLIGTGQWHTWIPWPVCGAHNATHFSELLGRNQLAAYACDKKLFCRPAAPA